MIFFLFLFFFSLFFFIFYVFFSFLCVFFYARVFARRFLGLGADGVAAIAVFHAAGAVAALRSLGVRI
jgi:hypothetical protein